MSMWLTGDPTFLRKMDSCRRELEERKDKAEGTKAEGRTAPPLGTASSSSATYPNDRNIPEPPQRPRRSGRR